MLLYLKACKYKADCSTYMMHSQDTWQPQSDIAPSSHILSVSLATGQNVIVPVLLDAIFTAKLWCSSHQIVL